MTRVLYVLIAWLLMTSVAVANDAKKEHPKKKKDAGVERVSGTNVAVHITFLPREVRLHDPAFELQRGRNLVLLGAEVAREDREALDLLVARAVGVHVVDDRLNALADGRRIEALRLVRVDRDQRRDVSPTVTDDEGL